MVGGNWWPHGIWSNLFTNLSMVDYLKENVGYLLYVKKKPGLMNGDMYLKEKFETLAYLGPETFSSLCKLCDL